ncbi:MAG: peptidylprolyl isomerase [Elusimicrobia bacterium]|nr:peptidylprolyl isomerase [Elusimicrobiota bacterium]
MKKIVLLSTIVIGCAAAVLSAATMVDKTVAMVNNEAIMSSEFDRLIAPVMEQYKTVTPIAEQSPEKIKEIKQRLLDQLVDDRVLKQEAVNHKIKVSKRDVDQGVAQVKKRFETDAVFQSELKKEDMSEVQFVKRIEEQLLVMKLIDQEIKAKTEPPKDEEVKAFYEKIQQKIKGKDLGLEKKDEEEIAGLAKLLSRASAEQTHARHILVGVEKNADMKTKAAALAKIKSIKKELKEGADFDALAKKYSDDPASKNKGGDLGFFAKGDMVPEFEKAAFALNVGQISEPVLTDFGYHIIKVEEKRAGKKASFDEVKNDLKEFLYQKSAQKRYEGWVKDLRSKASIKLNPIE